MEPPCYGIFQNRPHLRIENRAIPAGPTVLDEIANAAFYFGLMRSLLSEYGPLDKVMAFDEAKANFFAAARHGLQAQFKWVRGRIVSARDLILDELIPLARKGLQQAEISPEDIDRYLERDGRKGSQSNGAQWTLKLSRPSRRTTANRSDWAPALMMLKTKKR
jgi:gamma-glutamyl:cysteine ligase YbdK (ATP-grasp superfamily)